MALPMNIVDLINRESLRLRGLDLEGNRKLFGMKV
jgi:hypothetical protein